MASLGVPVAAASRLALLFSDSGDSGDDRAVLLDEPTPESRQPGHLIAGTATVFRVLYPVDGGEPVGRVDTLAAASAAPLRGDHLAYRAAVLIDLDRLHGRTLAALGMQAPRCAP